MKYNPDIHHSRSIRLKDYDYSQAGAYFVTICAKDKEYVFGDVVNGEVRLNELGIVAMQCWNAIPQHFPNVFLDEFIVMPNHVHGIIAFNVGAKNLSPVPHDSPIPGNGNVGAKHVLPIVINGDKTRAKDISPLHGTSMSIGSVVRGFKIGVTKWARNNAFTYMPWQRNYYEHIIRSEPELDKIREYIANNPLNWEQDENYKP